MFSSSSRFAIGTIGKIVSDVFFVCPTGEAHAITFCGSTKSG